MSTNIILHLNFPCVYARIKNAQMETTFTVKNPKSEHQNPYITDQKPYRWYINVSGQLSELDLTHGVLRQHAYT